jgi:hypothetical protein
MDSLDKNQNRLLAALTIAAAREPRLTFAASIRRATSARTSLDRCALAHAAMAGELAASL